jgi:alkylhydroperoxidase family enzyme
MVTPMNLTIHTTETAPADSRALLEGIAADLGFVPNLAATAAASPALLAGFDGLRRAVGGGRLDPVLREVAGLAVGVAVDNRYGVAFHSTVLGSLGVDEESIGAMRDGRAPKDERQAAVHDLARALVLGHGRVAEILVAAATDAGLSCEDILEVATETAFAGLVGTIDHLAGHVTLDTALEPRRWP